MELEKRIEAFAKLGSFLDEVVKSYQENDIKDDFVKGFKNQLTLAQEHNGWFTKDHLMFSINSWANQLNINSLNKWVKKYNFNNNNKKTVGIVMAGNIPLVGFHDFISVLISGHKVLVKQSSDDMKLLPYLAKYLQMVEPGFKDMIEFTEGRLENFDAIIATGSNNTSRYFDYYFKDKPSIIRKNRNSIAVLTAEETDEELELLSEDIFRYYGLGCRNVSKLFVPKDYDFKPFFNAMYSWKDIIYENKYANNYDYNKAVYLMSEFQFLDNGFLMLKKDEGFSSPIATVFYEEYDSLDQLKSHISEHSEQIQCIVAKDFSDNDLEFGTTQTPSLWDYADNVDTIEFLLNL